MIVADANLIAYLILPGERTEQAEGVLLIDPVWVVPLLCVSELRSVVNRQIRAENLTLNQAAAAMARAVTLIGGREAPVDSRDVLELSQRSGCSTYDCEYVALAIALGASLVTSDKAVLKAFPAIAVSPEEFTGAENQGWRSR